ncbi:hypothetical protein GGTG_13929 [Gaeumannomyces tritici R3-111a-1]|uniref:Uncharacterized protein n=1 Tax=Gaeumannomyces tritici (strain R3-111a-1) TaxID=644352 RepID=J3PK79_GAET3|nr:hypothetical protein, variant [Gaeumannomyces tritici R3-111a-1]XP_009230118.1 hypothetical protein GGTG_13929 [Gaeumannomyces tritici R3-111a-1]EJT68499.1 hypothetical protein, variant [Gaeumannomyces tritici R3-111a-1]EJT68500.1 hypothetical protein GGTG_13929 [Gaeumannomyces tritici R3-111a-1]
MLTINPQDPEMLLGQGPPGSILSVPDPASDDPYSPPPADAIASGLAPFPYVNPAEIFCQERHDTPLQMYGSPGGDGGSNSDPAGLTNDMAQIALGGDFLGAGHDGKEDNVDLPLPNSDVALPPAPTSPHDPPLDGGKKKRIKLVTHKQRTSEASDGTAEPPKKKIILILKI